MRNWECGMRNVGFRVSGYVLCSNLTARSTQDAKYAKIIFLSDRVTAGIKTNRHSTIQQNLQSFGYQFFEYTLPYGKTYYLVCYLFVLTIQMRMTKMNGLPIRA